MPDADGFDARIGAAVRAFADAAQTQVDAAGVADRVAGADRASSGPHRARTWIPALGYLVLVGLLLVVLAWVLAAGAGSDPGLRAVAMPSGRGPSPAPTDLLPDVLRPGHVSGVTSTTLSAAPGTVSGNGAIQLLDLDLDVDDRTDDPRATGTGTLLVDVTMAPGDVGVVQGTYHLQTADGTWQGSCTGAVWGPVMADGRLEGDLDCWLTGAGAYAGLTYFRHSRTDGGRGPLTGVIEALPAPSPPGG